MSRHFAVPILLAGAMFSGACASEATPTPPDPKAEQTAEINRYFDGMSQVRPRADQLPAVVGLEVDVIPKEAAKMPGDQLTAKALGAIVMISSIAVEGTKHADMEIFGSGFLMVDGPTNEVRVVTAGHVIDEVVPGTLKVTTNDGVRIAHLGGDASKSDTPQEDLGFVYPEEPEELRKRALQARDLGTNPLRLGEKLYVFNFQGDHAPGNPAIYPALYAGRGIGTNDDTIEILENLAPGIDEDDMRPAGSGGVAVDQSGEVVGIGIHGMVEEFKLDYCDKPIILSDEPIRLGGREVKLRLRPPATIDECADMDTTTLRAAEPGRTFKPKTPPIYVPV